MTATASTTLPTFKCGTWYDPDVFARLDRAIAEEGAPKERRIVLPVPPVFSQPVQLDFWEELFAVGL